MKAKEILYKHSALNKDGFTSGQVIWILAAMEEYADYKNEIMKTAMQEMIDWLNSQYNICIKMGKQHEADFLNGHISVAISLLEKEKVQLAKLNVEIRNVQPVNEPDVWQGKKEKI